MMRRAAAIAASSIAMIGCALGWSAALSPLAVLRGGSSDQRFARADAVREFEFPRDHGAHPAYRHEWWYFTGHLRATDGERFGFEVTFFRIALAPPVAVAAGARHGSEPRSAKDGPHAPSGAGSTGEGSSRWRARQVYVAHFAVTDIAHGTFHSTQRFARDALGLAGAQAAPFRVWLGSWSVAQQHAASQTAADRATGRAEPTEASDWVLQVADPAYGLALQLHPLGPPVLNGDRGLSIKSGEPGAASYYYSIPRLEVRGQLVRRGGEASQSRPLEVSGTAWLDREWGSGALGAHQQGWDWFALQFADGSALMFYALRDDGGGRDPHSAGTWIAADGSSRALASGDVRIEVLKRWTSPRGGRYPSAWRVRVVPLGLDVTATPVLADQELETTPRYWEGDVDVSGAREGRRLSGQGYVELVGYARR